MKIFTKKIFMLTIGMVLSVGVYAQNEIKHRFPQLDYTNAAGTTHAFIPAWDIQMYDAGAIPGCIRLQITEIINLDVDHPENNKFKCKIVNRLGNLSDLSNFHYTSSTTNVSFTGKNGSTVTKQAGQVKYSDFIDIDTYDEGTWFEGTDYNHSDYQVFNFKTDGKHYVYGDFVIPEKYVNSKYGEFQITDIDIFGFRNNTVDHAQESDKTKYWFRPESVTIPATIKSIGLGAFLNNTSTTKVTIASNSEISEISARAFMNMASLEEINLPASVTKIDGAALGGCTNLEKIIFEGATPPTTFGTIQWTPSNQPTVTCDWIMANSASFENLTPAKCIIEVPLHSAKSYINANNRFIEFPMSSKFKMKKDYVSYCSELPFTFKQYNTSSGAWNNGDVKVYYVTDADVKLSEGKIDIREITETKIPSETEEGITPYATYNDETGFETGYFGVILSGIANETYNIFYPNNVACDTQVGNDALQKNLLQGIIEDARIVNNDNYLYFVLSNGKFLTVESAGTLGANKAFLFYSGDQTMPLGARELAISLPEETGIATLETKSLQNDVWYTLQGIQVNQPSKGIFIKNGKKFVIK